MSRLAFLLPLLPAALIALWLQRVDEVALRWQLARGQFWALEAQFLLLGGLTAKNLPRFVRSLELDRRGYRAAAAVSVLMLALAGGVAPRANRIFYDEHIYQGVGQNLSDLHLAQMCNDGTVEYGSLQCLNGEYNKQPYGYPYLLSLGYRLFGVHEWVAHGLNLLCAVGLVWVVFLGSSALLGDPRAGLYGAVVLSLAPQQLMWSHTAAVEPSAALGVGLAVIAALHHVRERSTASLLWVVVATAFAVKFRPESVLVIPLVGLIFLLQAPGELARPRVGLAAALGLVLCALDVAHLWAVRGEPWGATGPSISLAFFWPNLRVNGGFYVDGARFPAVYALLALVGLGARPLRGSVLLGLWFLAFWGVFLFFYAGSYGYGADVRFSLVSMAPLAALAGQGASRLHAFCERSGLRAPRPWLALGGALLVQFSWYLPQVRAIGEEAWSSRADVEFAKRLIPDLPRNSVVLTHNPSIFLLNGVNAAQMSLAARDAGFVTNVLGVRYGNGVFLHWNAWCNFDDPLQRQFCADALQLFPSEVFREYGERGFKFAFYRLKPEGVTLQRVPVSGEPR
jgi:hypothetical protein